MVKFGENSALDGLVLCPRRQSAGFRGQTAQLPDYSFRLLDLLNRRAPDPAGFAEIEDVVWGAAATRDTIKQRVQLLRASLGEIGVPSDAVASVRSVGYRLTIPCRTQSEMAPPSLQWARAPYWTWGAAAMILLAAGFTFLDRSQSQPRALRVAIVEHTAPTGSMERALTMRISSGLAEIASKLSHIDALAPVTADALDPIRAKAQARVLGADALIKSVLTKKGGAPHLSLFLIDAETEVIRWSQSYSLDGRDPHKSIAHFLAVAQQELSALRVEKDLSGYGRGDRDAYQTYFEAVRRARIPKRENLLAARASLDALIARHQDFAPAMALRARINAEMVLRHGGGAALAQTALAEARAAAALDPLDAQIQYALSRADLAAGNRHAALARLKTLRHVLPSVDRDIQALARRLATTGTQMSSSLH